jgi:hypothetical protein
MAEATLANQVAGVSVSDRETTDAGFLTHLSVPEGAEPIPSMQSEAKSSLGGCGLYATELSAGAECLIHFTHGLISSIEVWSFAGGHPSDLGQFELRPLQVNYINDLPS